MSSHPFVEVLVFNPTTHEIEWRFVKDGPPVAPKLQSTGKYRLELIQPNNDARHIALGRFLDAWSRLEQQIARALAGALAIPWERTSALMNGLGNRGQVDTLRALLPNQLSGEDAETLNRILDRVKANNTKRNNIIHGYWILEVVITDRNGAPHPNYREYRRYDPSDPTVAALLDQRANKHARKSYMFSVARINAITKELERLRDDLASFTTRNLKNAPDQLIDIPIK